MRGRRVKGSPSMHQTQQWALPTPSQITSHTPDAEPAESQPWHLKSHSRNPQGQAPCHPDPLMASLASSSSWVERCRRLALGLHGDNPAGSVAWAMPSGIRATGACCTARLFGYSYRFPYCKTVHRGGGGWRGKQVVERALNL